mgnify:CR=1 FL=1
MAQCVLVADGGALTVTNDAPQACQGYLMLTPGEFQNATTFYTWMQVPSQADFGDSVCDGIWAGGGVLLGGLRNRSFGRHVQ